MWVCIAGRRGASDCARVVVVKLVPCRSHGLVVAFAVALAALAAAGGSAQADPLGVVDGEILDVSADRLSVDVDQGTAVLEGKVHARLGELDVRCPKITVRYNKAPKVRWARGSGGVVATVKGIEARAKVVEVDVAARRVNLAGGVRLTRGRGWVTADQATIDLATRTVSLREVEGSIPVEPPQR